MNLYIRGWGRELVVAFSFLTILPVPSVAFEVGLLGRSGRWFPVVGLVIGLLLVATAQAFMVLFPVSLTALLLTALWVVLTGGLHLDGVADCCDGLLAPVSTERRLEIMRDPRSGAFAVIGVVLVLMLKWNTIATLLTVQSMASTALLSAPIWARWFLLWIALQRPACASGLGSAFYGSLTKRALLVAAIVPLLTLCFFFQLRLLAGIVLASCVTVLITYSTQRRLGGTTGDVYGLTVELCEITVLLASATLLHG